MLEKKLGYSFHDKGLLECALTHSSLYKGVKSYQRLEFLGDAVVGIIASHLLYERYPEMAEGDLSRRMSWLVGEQGLASVGRELELGPAIRLGSAEEAAGGRERDSMLADIVEAVAAAAYIDGGLEAARSIIEPRFALRLATEHYEAASADAKTALQSVCQSSNQETPKYETIRTDGTDHEPVFDSSVSWDGRFLGRGRGGNKKSAEQAAALAALQVLSEEK